jgi:hypothetical protein
MGGPQERATRWRASPSAGFAVFAYRRSSGAGERAVMLPNICPGVSKPLPDAKGRYLMLGLGRQSVAMLMLAERGLIGPKPDAAIVADMGKAERGWAREMLRTLQSPNFPLSIPIITVQGGDLEGDFEAATAGLQDRFSNPPLFVENDDGSRGRLTRSCTRDHKITTGIAEIKRQLGFAKGARMPVAPIAEQWIGFSFDERHRAAPHPAPWLHTRWPLIEIGWTVQQCEQWVFQEYGIKVRHSGCYFCPNAGDGVWLDMKLFDPEEFERACQMDDDARHGMPNVRQPAYLHDSLKPLRSIDFAARIAERRGRLLDYNEDGINCRGGHCGT